MSRLHFISMYRMIGPWMHDENMPRLKLFSPSSVPPDGFRYVFPQDGFVAHAWDYATWFEVASKHAAANQIVCPSTDDMEEQLCQTLPPSWCRYDDPNRARPNVNLGWQDVQNALQTFVSWLKGGLKTVSQDEAERRALICSRCYLNVNVEGCAGCQQLVREISKSTKHDSHLRACAVCKCVLKAMVHFRIEDLVKTTAQKDLYCNVSHCWLNPNGENYRD